MLELWNQLPSETQTWLLGTAGNAVGAVVAEFVNQLQLTLRGRARKAFQTPEREAALQRAVANSFAVALGYWTISEETEAHYCELFKAWLLRPDVLSEFNLLLAPTLDSELDIELLHEEFEATGLSSETLLSVSFPVLMQDMVGAFYLSAAEEDALQQPLKIGLLREMTERIGVTAQHLERIKQLNEQQVTVSQQVVELHKVSKQQDEQRNRLLVNIEKLLADIRAGIRLPASLTADELKAIEEKYRQTIVNLFETLTFKGISPSGRAIALPLADVYVKLKAVAEVPESADTFSADERRFLMADEEGMDWAELKTHLDTLRVERWWKITRLQNKRLPRRSIHETLSDPTQHGVVILGDPGAGKTTLLHYLALCAAKGEGRVAEQLPIFVPLAAYDEYLRRSESHVPLGEFLAIYYAKWLSLPSLGPLFAQALEAGRALVLLDGLDEVLEKGTRQFVTHQVDAFIQRWMGRGNWFALSSRIVGYREARLSNKLPHVTVLDFGRDEIERFAKQWCYTYETWVAGGNRTMVVEQRAEREMKLLLADVRSNRSVERLAANPLLLTMLALLRRQVGKLPDRRIELYERYIRTLIDNWEEARSVGARQEAPERFDPHMAIFYLIELAFWLQQHKPSGTAGRRELEAQLVTICLNFAGHEPAKVTPKIRIEATKEAARFLNDMRHFAGLLAERGHDAFGFLHLTFQEYFAGRALARMTEEERQQAIKPYLHHPRWREPILLCAGQLGVIEQRRDQVNQMVRWILQANSEHEAMLHRDKFLAVAIARDDVGLVPSVLEELAQQLIPLQESQISTMRDNVLTGLAQLVKLNNETSIRALQTSLQNQALTYHILQALKPVITVDIHHSLYQEIKTCLDDPDYQVRQAAAQAMVGQVRQDKSLHKQIALLLSDPFGRVREAAVQAMAGQVGLDRSLREKLITCLSDSDYRVRQAAAKVLADEVRQDETLREEMISHLFDTNNDMRHATVQVLGRLVNEDKSLRIKIEMKLYDLNYEVWSGKFVLE